MELYTLDRNFLKQETIDEFAAAIWTERFYGDGDFELHVPASPSMMSKLPKGVLMMCEDSEQPMILETREVKDRILKTTGITLTKWLNNRIFRTSNDHSVKEQLRDTQTPGELIQYLVSSFCIGGNYLNGTVNIGIAAVDRNRFDIPGLVLGDTYLGGDDIEIAIPFGPIFDNIYSLATTYEIGMRIILDYANESDYQISFNTWQGEDRTSEQSINPVIRFSAEMDSFANITDLDSLSDHRNLVLSAAANAPATYMTNNLGRATSVPDTTDGFDLRVHQEFDDFDTAGLTVAKMGILLNEHAKKIVSDLKAVQLVDGEVVQNKQINYGVDYFLGDLIEVAGNSGVLQKARITEYIRSQDEAGERAYPTVAMIDE